MRLRLLSIDNRLRNVMNEGDARLVICEQWEHVVDGELI
jgi:hypothetical protein